MFLTRMTMRGPGPLLGRGDTVITVLSESKVRVVFECKDADLILFEIILIVVTESGGSERLADGFKRKVQTSFDEPNG